MSDAPFDLEKAYCSLRAQHGVLLALISTHPNRPALHAALTLMANEAYGAVCDSPTPDAVLDQITTLLHAYAKLAEDRSIPSPG